MMNAKTVLGAGMQEHLNNCWLVKRPERRMDEMINDVDGAKHRVKSAAESSGCHSTPEKT